jgi:hypothetical protein
MRRETTPKQENTKTPVSPLGAGETNKDKLCGLLTLLQDEINFIFLEQLTFIWRYQVFYKAFYDKKIKCKVPGSTGRVLEGAKLQKFSNISSCTCQICTKKTRD